MNQHFESFASTQKAPDVHRYAGVTVIIPALNEAEALPYVLDDLPRVGRVIVVDNGSTDATAAVARQHDATVVMEPQRGYGAACLRGIAELESLAQAGWGNRLACALIRMFWGVRFTDLGPMRAISYPSLRQLQMCDQDSEPTGSITSWCLSNTSPGGRCWRGKPGRSEAVGSSRDHAILIDRRLHRPVSGVSPSTGWGKDCGWTKPRSTAIVRASWGPKSRRISLCRNIRIPKSQLRQVDLEKSSGST